VLAEEARELGEEDDVSLRVHLERCELGGALLARALQLLAQADEAVLEVDVSPAQAEELPLAHPRVQKAGEERASEEGLGAGEQALDLLLVEDASVLGSRLRPFAALELGEGVLLDVVAAAGVTEEAALRRLDRAESRRLDAPLAQGLREGDDLVGADARKLALAPGGEDVLGERPAIVLERARAALAGSDLGGEAGEELLDRRRHDDRLLQGRSRGRSAQERELCERLPLRPRRERAHTLAPLDREPGDEAAVPSPVQVGSHPGAGMARGHYEALPSAPTPPALSPPRMRSSSSARWKK
jgi:hypothetical protein